MAAEGKGSARELAGLTGQGLIERVEAGARVLAAALGTFEQKVRRFSATTEVAQRGRFSFHTRAPAVPVGLFAAGERVVAAFDVPGVETPEVADLLRVFTREGRTLRPSPNPLANHKALARWISDLYLSHRGRVSLAQVLTPPGMVVLAFDVSHGEGQPPRRHLLGLDLSGGLEDTKLVRHPTLPERPAADFVGMGELSAAHWQPSSRTNAYYHHTQAGPLYVFVDWGTLKIRDHLEVPRGPADLAIEGAAEAEHPVNPHLAQWLPAANAEGEGLLKVVASQGRAPIFVYYSSSPRRFMRIDLSAIEGVELPSRLGRLSAMVLEAGGEATYLGGSPASPATFFESPGGRDRLYTFESDAGPQVLHHFDLDKRQVLNSFWRVVAYTLLPDGHLVFLPGPAAGRPEAALEHAVELWITPFRRETEGLSPDAQRFLRSFSIDAVDALVEGWRVVEGLLGAEQWREARARLDQLLVDHSFIERVEDVREAVTTLHEALSRCVNVEVELAEIHDQRRDTQAQLGAQAQALEQALRAGAPAEIEGILKAVEARRALLGRVEQSAAQSHLPPDVIEGQAALRRELGAAIKGLSEQGARRVEDATAEVMDTLGAQEEESGRLSQLPEVIGRLEQLQRARALLTTRVEQLRLLELEPRRSLALAERATAGVVLCDRLEAILVGRRRELSASQRQEAFGAWVLELDLRITTEPALLSEVEACQGRADALVAEIEARKAEFADFPELIEKLELRIGRARARFEARKVELLRLREEADAQLTAEFRLRAAALAAAARTVDLGAEALEGWFSTHPEGVACVRIVERLRQVGLVGRAGALQGQLDQLRRLIQSERQEAEIFSAEGESLRLGGVHLHRNRLVFSLEEAQVEGEVGLALTGTALTVGAAALGGLRTPEGYRGLLAETDEISRSEVLTWRVLTQAEGQGKLGELVKEAGQPADGGLPLLQERARSLALSLPEEGYTLGQHDRDAARLLKAITPIWARLGTLRWTSQVRVEALRALSQLPDPGQVVSRARAMMDLSARLGGGGSARRIFQHALPELPSEGLDYLEGELKAGGLAGEATPSCHPRAQGLAAQVTQLVGAEPLEMTLAVLGSPAERYELLLPEITRLLAREAAMDQALAPEVAWLLASGAAGGSSRPRGALSQTRVTVGGLSGSHARMSGSLTLDVPAWRARLTRFVEDEIPRFALFRQGLGEVRARMSREWDVGGLLPRPLARFAWTRLLRRVYLPLVARALEKQLGSLDRPGEDQMGVLLLVSPPGYGKTELLKKIASLLGYAFVSISGTSLGKQTTSLDPMSAPDRNAAAALSRLLFGMTLKENVLLDIEDIQACSDAFLEKLLPLCDATRTVEVVVDGRPQLIELQGRRVAVVMTLNPLRAQVPQALANRATLINLGDVADKHASDFALSYLEVAGPFNRVLEPTSSQRDLEALALALESGRPLASLEAELNGRYAHAEMVRIEAVLRHAIAVRDVLIAINRACLHSATIEDSFRVEPPFELQGSYRDMVEICRSIEPDWTEEQRAAAVLRHYEGQAGLLGARGEYNLLVIKSLMGGMGETERERLAHIRHVFLLAQQRDQTLLTLLDRVDQVSEAVARVPASVSSLGELLAQRMEAHVERLGVSIAPLEQIGSGVGSLPERLAELNVAAQQPLLETLGGLRGDLQGAMASLSTQLGAELGPSLARVADQVALLPPTLTGELLPGMRALVAQVDALPRALSAQLLPGIHRLERRLSEGLSGLFELPGPASEGNLTPQDPSAPPAESPSYSLDDDDWEVEAEPPLGQLAFDYERALAGGDARVAALLEARLGEGEASMPQGGEEGLAVDGVEGADAPARAPEEGVEALVPQAKPTHGVSTPHPARPTLVELLSRALAAAPLRVDVVAGGEPAWVGQLREELQVLRADISRIAAAAERPRPDPLATLRQVVMSLPDPSGKGVG